MSVTDASDDWPETLTALRFEADRVTSLLRSIDVESGPAVLGQWKMADVAAHLAQVWIAIPSLAKGDLSDVEGVLADGQALPASGLIRELSDLGKFTTDLTAMDGERDLSVLADRIDERAERFFAACAGQDPEAPRSWLVEGITLPFASFAGHLLSETVVHGHDIASGAGRPWPISTDHARLVLQKFLFPAMAHLDPRALVDAENAAGFRGSYELRIRGGNRYRLQYDDGELRVERSSGQPVDCRISADPTALLLLTWGRQGQWPAILRGKLVAWGAKPWLAPRLPSLMKNP